MRVTKNTIKSTSTGMRFQWLDYPVIDWTAMEALEIAHQILQRKETLMEIIRQEQRKQQKVMEDASSHDNETKPTTGTSQPLP